jgi:hypothetical protein
MTTIVQFFIPGIVATALDVAQLALGCKASSTPASRLSYRFTYRVSRGGPVYGCRIKASRRVATVLADQVYALADRAEAEGDTAMVVGCALAVAAIEQQTLH